ncbi:hypothetical protein MRBLMR1_004840 [Neorhizobium sp. LMR1-1-1.1]
MEVHVTPIKTFALSGRKLCLTDEGGTLTGGVRKDYSPLERTFSSGAVTLMDADGGTAVDPVNLAAVLDFCERIVEGDQRAMTQPGAGLMLASAFIAIVLTWPVPSEPSSTEAA